ncbi:MAG: prepilin-type N-terminal cleavage/methylation domain-containing protein [Phycisphaerae bacterium]|nr:prepilin-type N-terminal cleavage/methylation domain-containing protein [Phycisphaerae bacterium]
MQRNRSDAVRVKSATTSGGQRAARSDGFTLIELLVSIAIIAILITLVAAGAAHFTKVARGVSERQTVVQMNQAVQAFKQEFGFLPPLVNHTDTVRPVEYTPATNPKVAVPNSYGSAVAGGVNSFNGNTVFLEGFSNAGDPRSGNQNSTRIMSSDWAPGSAGATATGPDYRFSEYSLAYYLVGALPRGLDGVEGPGMFRPRADGSFEIGSSSASGRVNDVAGKSYQPFVDPTRRSPKLEIDLRTFATRDADLTWRDPATNQNVSLNTRSRLLSPAGKAYRYYRWSPRQISKASITYYDPAGGNFNRVEDGIDRLNVPSLLGDPRTDADLRNAEYAIVSCGPDGFFGDMNLEGRFLPKNVPAGQMEDYDGMLDMAKSLKIAYDPAKINEMNTAIRKAARADNIVEVGR